MTITHHPDTVGHRLICFAREYGDRPALTAFDDYRRRRYTYRQLLGLAVQTAGLLLERGCRKGERVMIIAENSAEYTLLIFAAAILGLKVVPVDFNIALNSVDNVVAAEQPRLVFSSRADLLERLNDSPFRALDIERLGEEITSFPHRYEALDQAHPGCNWYVDENDVYIHLFTSGTTSEPKTVPLTHRNLLSNVAGFRKACFVPEDQRLLCMAPLSHALGLTIGLYCILSYGASVVYIKRPCSANIMRVMHSDRIDAVLTVPAFLAVLKDRIEEDLAEQGKLEAVQRILPKMLKLPVWMRRLIFRKLINKIGGDIKWIATGASGLNAEVGNFWEAVGVKVCQGYGMTECLIVSASDFECRKMGTVGKSLPQQEVRLDENGEILVAGPHVFDGYVGREDLNEEIFADGWFRTGDIGKIDEDGHISIVGRIKNVIIGQSGLNIYPEDIEESAISRPGVQDCLVVNMPEQKDELYLVAAIVLSPGSRGKVDPDALLSQINSRLSSHQRLARIHIWRDEDFPRTPSKKVKRDQVKASLELVAEQIRSGKSTTEPVADACSLEARLVKMIATLLKRNPSEVSLQHSLTADFGLDSLGMVELVTTIEERLGKAVPQDALFNRDLTVGELVELIRTGPGRQDTADPELRVPMLERAALACNRAISRGAFAPIFRAMYRLEIEDRNVLDYQVAPALKERGHIIVANHSSHLDSPSILYALPFFLRGKIVAAAAADHFFTEGARLQHWALLSLVRAFRVNRTGNPREYFQHIGEILDQGDSVLIFPEGTRSRSGKLGPFLPSVGQMIRQLRAPVIPAFIHGTHELWPPDRQRPRLGKIRVRFDKPLAFPRDRGPYEISDELFDLYRSEFGHDKE